MNQLVCLLVGKIKHYLQTKALFTYTLFPVLQYTSYC